jgi:hypothetical protein
VYKANRNWGRLRAGLGAEDFGGQRKQSKAGDDSTGGHAPACSVRKFLLISVRVFLELVVLVLCDRWAECGLDESLEASFVFLFFFWFSERDRVRERDIAACC